MPRVVNYYGHGNSINCISVICFVVEVKTERKYFNIFCSRVGLTATETRCSIGDGGGAILGGHDVDVVIMLREVSRYDESMDRDDRWDD